MKNAIKVCLASVILSLLCQSSLAAAVTGTWVTIDDRTNKKRSIVRITEHKGRIYGRILRVFKQEGDTGICKKCPGGLKDKPIKGLQIMWGLKKSGDNLWDGGKILDPKTGKVYRVKLTLSPDGKTLDVRGYVGISLLGRTQVWHRQ